MRMPWRKWYPADWLSEIAFAKTTLAARGLWAEALNVMMVSNSFCLEGSLPEMARILRCCESELRAALPSLISSGVADVTQRENGRVTLVSRRLLREDKSRRASKLRAQRFRQKPFCNAEVPSASVSGSDSFQKEGSAEGRVVELPHNFPDSPDAAIRQAGTTGADPTFITTLWNSAMVQNGYDGKGQPIRNWSYYVAKHWPREVGRRSEAKNSHSALPVWRQINNLEEEISKHPANRESVFHRQDATELQKADLRAKRNKLDELKSA